jgi:hypothetical protein
MWRQLCEFDSMFYQHATIVLCSSFSRQSIYFTESGGDCAYTCCTDSNFLLQNECSNNINGKLVQQLTEIQLCGNESERKVEKIRCPAGWILVTCWNLLSKSGIWGLGAFICPKSPFVQSHWLCFFVHQLAKIHPIKLLVRDLRNSRILNSGHSLFMWTLHCMLYVRKLPWKCITGTAVIHVWFEKNLKTNIKADGAFESSK